jgi:hypothetical protein
MGLLPRLQNVIRYPLTPRPRTFIECDERWSEIKGEVTQAILDMWNETGGKVDLREWVSVQYRILLSDSFVLMLISGYTLKADKFNNIIL